MKWLIYILLLVNLGIFVWHYQGGDRPSASLSGDQATSLVLLREYREQQEKKSSPGSAEGQGSVCYSLGPFEKKAAADKALNLLNKARIKAWRRVDSDSVRAGFWVLLPPARSRQEAAQSLQKLKRIKAKDFFLVATGSMKNAISLGVFSKAKLARARVEVINQHGFNARIEKVALPRRIYWLDWDKESGKQPAEELLDSLREQFKGIGQSQRRCHPEAHTG